MILKFVAHSHRVLRIARRYGWLPGARYTNLRDVRRCDRVGFLDIEWKNYSFERHLKAAKATRPAITVSDPYVRRVGYFWKFHWQSIRRSRITPVPDLPHRHRSEVRMSYQITFKDNCICLESVAVPSPPESAPAPPIHPLLLGP